jgi:Leucine-rich repeat (LRR) protein
MNGDNWNECSAPAEYDPASIDLANIACNLTTTNATDLFPTDISGTNAWLSPDSECTWGGVSCYAENTANSFKVNVIEMESNGLSGTLPEEMQELTAIRFLALERGEISGTIPNSFGTLQSLLLLDLDYNELTGTLPDTLWTLASLRQLDLNNNNFVGPLSEDIGLLTELRFIQVDNNDLTGTIPGSLGEIPNISECAVASYSLICHPSLSKN